MRDLELRLASPCCASAARLRNSRDRERRNRGDVNAETAAS
jgi:hypothetical protein